MNETEALIKLSRIPTLGSVKIRLLISQFGSAVEAVKAAYDELAFLPGFSDKVLDSWNKNIEDGSWADELEMACQNGVQIVPFTSPNYPKRLLEITDYPVLLYVMGELKSCDQQCLAIVGTRFATTYGKEQAAKISRELVSAGFTIVSGLARGIDVAAHESALKKGGRTIAVIGSGLSNIYPREHILLSEWIAEQGAVISEFPMNAPPDRHHFPQRNRIVSGMSLGTLLIEAPKHSGAMITMDRAFSQERKLFAIPGPTDMETFKGNHWLIKTGKADLVENGADIVESFQDLFSIEPAGSKTVTLQYPTLEPEELELIHKMPDSELSLEEIHRITQIPTSKLNVLMMSLLLKKVIKEYPGKIYKKISEYIPKRSAQN